MPRLMSVSHTADAVIERRKTVTRRRGWRMLRPGDRLTLCRKVMGRKPGEPLERLAEVEVINVRRERLDDMRDADIDREGVRGLPTVEDWIDWYAMAFGVAADDLVTRIEWRYL